MPVISDIICCLCPFLGLLSASVRKNWVFSGVNLAVDESLTVRNKRSKFKKLLKMVVTAHRLKLVKHLEENSYGKLLIKYFYISE